MAVASSALVDDQGKVAVAGKRDIAAQTEGAESELTLLVPVKASPMGYQLRVAVADANGRLGSVERRVTNAIVTAGPARLGQVFVHWSTSDGRNLLAFDIAPQNANQVSLTMDVYAGTGALPDPSVRFDGRGPRGRKPVNVLNDPKPLEEPSVPHASCEPLLLRE